LKIVIIEKEEQPEGRKGDNVLRLPGHGTASLRQNGSVRDFFRAAGVTAALLSRFLQSLPSVRGRRSFRSRENPLLPSLMTLSSRRPLHLFSFLLVALLLALCPPVASFAKNPATIVRVVDGDTIEGSCYKSVVFRYDSLA